MSKRSIIWAVVGGVVLILVAAGLIYLPKLQQQWTTPLGPGLDLPTYTPTVILPSANGTATGIPAGLTKTDIAASGAGAQIAVTASPGSAIAANSSKTAVVIPNTTPTSKPLCGGPPVMTILGVGADHGESSNYRYGLGDAIKIARIDFVTPKVTVLSIPRDIWVNIPDLDPKFNINQGKLNQSYFYGSPGMGYYTGSGGQPGLMARTLDLNFGLRVDHYGAVNMEVFKKLVDAVGGIDVYLPTDVDGTPIDSKTANMGYFYAGQQHFNGDKALRFSRIRKRYNDFTRQDNQNIVICALQKKLTQPEVLTKIPQIIAAFKGQVLTDLSLEQFGQLACLLPKLDRKNIIMTGLPEEIFSSDRQYSPMQKDLTYVLKVDNSVIRDYISQFVAGTWPTQPDEPTCK